MKPTTQITSSYDDGSNPSNMTNEQMQTKVDGYMGQITKANTYVDQIKKQHQQ